MPIFILAALSGLGMLTYAFTSLPFFLYIMGCLLHYWIIAIPVFFSFSKREARKVQKQKEPQHLESFHTCEECGKKDTDDPTAYFRITQDGKELCNACLEKAKN